VFGALAALVSLNLRKSLTETTTASERKDKDAGSLRGLLKHKRAFITVLGFTAGGSLVFYTFTTYMQKYLVNTVGMAKSQASLISAATLIGFVLLQPVFGALSDRIGRRPLLIAFGLLGSLFTVPIFSALGETKTALGAFWLIMAALLIVSLDSSVSAIVKAELFPVEIRALGVGLPYALTVSLFGGTAEYIALWTKSLGHETWFYWYVTACILVSLTCYLWMPDTRNTSRIDQD